MADITIVEVQSRRQRKAFAAFPLRLYADCAYYVPELTIDLLETFSPAKNPAFETADAKVFLALSDGEVVGRIAGIVSHIQNRQLGLTKVRFGWFDCIDDFPVAAALFDAVEDWGRAQGMTVIGGPEGFSGFDKAGMLTEGYDRLPTMATYYNYPYYNDLVTQYGFAKDVDFFEYLVCNLAQNPFPARLADLAEKIQQRKGYRVLEFANKKAMLRRAPEVLDLMLEAYRNLHDFTPITDGQKDYYIKKFFPYLDKDLVKVVVNSSDEVIGLFVAIPSLSKALQKTKGRLLPFGFLHLLRAVRYGNEVMDMGLGAVKEEYRGRGVDLVMALAMHRTAVKRGFTYAESNPELEENLRVRSEWKHFEHIQHKRRRLYKKAIAPKASS